MRLVKMKQAMEEMQLGRNTIMAFCTEHPECLHRFTQVQGARGVVRVDMDEVKKVLKESNNMVERKE